MNAMRRVAVLLLVGVFTACGGGEEGAGEAGMGEAEGAGGEAGAPAGDDTPTEVTDARLSAWTVRLDQRGDASGFRITATEEGMDVITGPAGIAWRPVDLVEQGDFEVTATFTQTEAPVGHREAYGLLVGGRNLNSPDQQYTYFLVRGTGEYLVKRRDGTSTAEIAGWNASPAVNAIESEGAATTNTLAVDVRGDQVEFSVNGTVVETLPVDQAEPYGFAGLRVNHRLNVAVSGWDVSGAAAGQAAGG